MASESRIAVSINVNTIKYARKYVYVVGQWSGQLTRMSTEYLLSIIRYHRDQTNFRQKIEGDG